MKRTVQKISIKWLLAIILQFILIGCATGQTMVFHSFRFDTLIDSPDAQVLDYDYGSRYSKEYDATGQIGIHANKKRVQRGEVFRSGGAAGEMPRGEYLYVKWRLKETGQVYEDTVDLRRRLPVDITQYGIHFVIKKSQLYVYLIPPPGVFPAGAMTGGSWPPGTNPSAQEKKVIAEQMSAYLLKHQIYPDQPQSSN